MEMFSIKKNGIRTEIMCYCVRATMRAALCVCAENEMSATEIEKLTRICFFFGSCYTDQTSYIIISANSLYLAEQKSVLDFRNSFALP